MKKDNLFIVEPDFMESVIYFVIKAKVITTTCSDLYKDIVFIQKVHNELRLNPSTVVIVDCKDKEEVNSMLYLYMRYNIYCVAKFNLKEGVDGTYSVILKN